MKKGATAIVALVLLALSDLFTKERKDESYEIRRAYIDVLGVFPTLDEIDWYCVYNNDSYEKAVEYLIGKINKPVEGMREWLLSEAYKKAPKKPLSLEELDRAICYFTGKKYSQNLLARRQIRLAFVSYAKLDAASDIDVIDNMASLLMSRTTKKDEANQLLACLNNAKSHAAEEDAWLLVLEELLKLEDVCSK